MRRSRSTFTLLLLFLIAAFAIPFLLPIKDGRPLLAFSSIEWPDLDFAALRSAISLPAFDSTRSSATSEVTFYRWRDADGVWRFSQQSPPAGVEYEVRSVDANANLIQGRPSAPQEASAPTAAAAQPPSPAVSAEPEPMLTPFDPGALLNTFREAATVEERLNERKAEYDRAIAAQ